MVAKIEGPQFKVSPYNSTSTGQDNLCAERCDCRSEQSSAIISYWSFVTAVTAVQTVRVLRPAAQRRPTDALAQFTNECATLAPTALKTAYLERGTR